LVQLWGHRVLHTLINSTMKLTQINEALPDDMPMVVKTKKGSVIKRSKYGVGKLIGGSLYLHRNYVTDLPNDIRKMVQDAEVNIEGFKYNTLKINLSDGSVTFINSPDFDTAQEPTVGQYRIVKDGKVKDGKSNSIWHHKWLWVKNDYTGFDVMDSFERSRKYLQMDIDFSRIGNKDFWEKNYGRKI